MTPRYHEFLTTVLSHPIQGPKHADVLIEVTRNVTNLPDIIKLTGGDPENIDGLIDAQLDRLIVASNSDQRLAMFALAAALGKAMQALTGIS